MRHGPDQIGSSTWISHADGSKSRTTRTVASLSPELLEAIVDVYGEDMRLYNYTTCLDEPWEKVQERVRVYVSPARLAAPM